MKLSKWKYPSYYLSAVGIANIGQWVYLLAINLIVLEMTGSALAVAGLYMIKPFARMFVGLWAGSVIDRSSTKHLMISLDVIRALLIVSIPFLDSIWIIYTLVLFIQMASAMFDPASFTYMTMLLPEHSRKRFNALLSFVHSGAFIMGPALAGILFMVGSLEMALFVNVGAFLLSAGLTFYLPNLVHDISTSNSKITYSNIRSDWHLVWRFSKVAFPFVIVYMVFQGVMLLTAALDSMEVAFSKEVLHLTDAAYGSLVSIAGIGFLMGSICTNIIVKYSTAKQMMCSGTTFVAIGYVIYSFSTTYMMASIGCFILACFLSLANTGFMTFIQEDIPIDMMGRISSLYGMVAHTIQLFVVLIMGLAAQWFSIQEVVISGSILMLTVAFLLIVIVTRLAASKIAIS
ncbi:MAG: MFS transporter [Paenisporosarcina sp.]